MSKPPKPRLADGQRVHAPDGRTAVLAGADAGKHILRAGGDGPPLRRRLARGLLSAVVTLAALGAAIYAVLALTVLVILPVGGEHAAVLRGAYPVGQVPSGAVVYVSGQPVGSTVADKADQALHGVPLGSIVQVVAGPYATVGTNDDGMIVADGQPTAFHGQVAARTLERTYVALCISGACTPGQAVLVGQDTVVGKVAASTGPLPAQR